MPDNPPDNEDELIQAAWDELTEEEQQEIASGGHNKKLLVAATICL